MKNLILYYSFTENNKKLAALLTKRLHCDSVGIETVKKRTGLSILLDLVFNRKPEIKTVRYYLRDYDHIIFIAPIWAGKIAMPLKSFLVDQKSNIQNYSFITICGGGNPGQKEKISNELSATIGKRPMKVAEMWINNLLPKEKKATIKYTSGYRIQTDEFTAFENDIVEFLSDIEIKSTQKLAC
jgi:flavodoxin